MPMPPPAPARFSTTTGCPRLRLIASATGRPTVSATPPGGKGTIIVTGRDGQVSAAPAITRTSFVVVSVGGLVQRRRPRPGWLPPRGRGAPPVSLAHAVDQRADVLDFDADFVAALQKARRLEADADAGRGARGDDV